jgi:hypothetical protein
MANDTEPKATVQLSPNLTDEDCSREAEANRRRWETGLRKRGSSGGFEIGHGKNLSCPDAHDSPRPFDRGLYIWTDAPGCNVFVTTHGNHRDYCGAKKRDPEDAYRGAGACTCNPRRH